MSDELIRRARAWMADDPDADTRTMVEGWLDSGDLASIERAFGPRLAFGTAGLRGPIGPGPAGMNRLSVRQATAGLAAWLDDQGVEGPVVVGYDARRGSAAFARDAAGVLMAAGRTVFRFPRVVPTPVLSYAVRQLGAAAGVMVTASHNPPDDNGYKVFWSDGAQIVPPHDQGIAQRIPSGAVSVSHEADREVPEEVIDRYVADVLALRMHGSLREPLTVVYTPMHGVGGELVKRVLGAVEGLTLHVVPEQAEPDGRFPTVAFPNPEEDGALDLAQGLAERVGADLVIANDPDADRLAVSVPTAAGWRQLTGNEVGWLLADDLLAHGDFPEPRGVATTLVSSTRLSAMADHHGVRYAETLTGFKWLARVSAQLAEAGGTLVLGYEEALGYSVGGLVRDKDGVSAALLFCDLVRHHRAEGRTLLDALDALDRRHGVVVGRQRALVRRGADGAQRIAAAMTALRNDPPASLGGHRVDHHRDLAAGGPLPPSNVLAYQLFGGHRALVRPSGTEPKLKLYVEAKQPVGDGPDGLVAARAAAAGTAEAILQELLQRVEQL
jgi:phosphomannomutase